MALREAAGCNPIIVPALGGEEELLELLETLDGLLLPGIRQIKTPEQQLRFARAKASIGPHEPAAIQRFEVDHFEESNESKTVH